ncbi:MAG: hypothetical protein M3Y08_01155 [Fibrobacterota bacterium]|nr:hypothetical protein [Fibrobacterota bacterium]
MDVMEVFRKQYFPFALGKRWFIIDFVEFQYGELKPSSNAHVSVINTLKKHDLFDVYLTRSKFEQDQQHEKQAVSGDPRRVQDKDKAMDMDKDKDKDLDPDLKSKKDSIASDVPDESIRATKLTLLKSEFAAVRKAYPGTRRSLDTEWDNFRKRCSPSEVLPLLLPAIKRGLAYREGCASVNAFAPNWPHMSTWVNQARWTEEFGAIPAPKAGGFNAPPATAAQLQATMDAVFSDSKGFLQ